MFCYFDNFVCSFEKNEKLYIINFFYSFVNLLHYGLHGIFVLSDVPITLRTQDQVLLTNFCHI